MSSDDTAPVPSPVTVDDYRAQAEEAMPDDYRLYVNNVDMEATLRGDLDAWQRLRVRPRALVDVSRRSTATTVLGQQIALPVISAPYVGSMLVHPDGEVAVARGCTAADTITTLSMMASRTPEEVGSVAAGRYWQQLYWPADRSILEDVVRRAFAAGASALCLTVDLPVSPWFPRAMRSAAESVSAQLGDGARAMFLARDYGRRLEPTTFADASVTWDDLAWLAGLSPLPIVLKGITRAEDAVLAHEHGAAGIIVSNHGGQGLAHAVPVAEALPAIVDATQGNVEVLVDGGIRSGLDVLRALALGARAVLVARPILWGLTVAGPQGVEGVVTSLRDEFDTSMALTGCTAIEDIDDAVFLPRRNPQP